MSERLRELVRRWRRESAQSQAAAERLEGGEWRSEARVLKDCADDLANILTDMHSTPGTAVPRADNRETIGDIVDEVTQPVIDPPKWIHAKDADEVGRMTTEGYMYWGDGLFMRADLEPDEMQAAYEEAMRTIKGREP